MKKVLVQRQLLGGEAEGSRRKQHEPIGVRDLKKFLAERELRGGMRSWREEGIGLSLEI